MKTFEYTCSACEEVHHLYEACPIYLQQFIDWLGDTWLFPLPYKLVILPDPEKSQVRSRDGGVGIILPERYQATPSMGTVIACGDKVAQIQPGQRVLYGNYAGINYETDSLFHLKLVKEDEIICRLLQQQNLVECQKLLACLKMEAVTVA